MSDVKVSNHAVVRYIERVMGVRLGKLGVDRDLPWRKVQARLTELDIDHHGIRRKIAGNDAIRRIAGTFREGEVTVAPGLVAIIKDGTVVTVRDAKSKKARGRTGERPGRRRLQAWGKRRTRRKPKASKRKSNPLRRRKPRL